MAASEPDILTLIVAIYGALPAFDSPGPERVTEGKTHASCHLQAGRGTYCLWRRRRVCLNRRRRQGIPNKDSFCRGEVPEVPLVLPRFSLERTSSVPALH